jgi:hypothetical protein
MEWKSKNKKVPKILLPQIIPYIGPPKKSPWHSVPLLLYCTILDFYAANQ